VARPPANPPSSCKDSTYSARRQRWSRPYREVRALCAPTDNVGRCDTWPHRWCLARLHGLVPQDSPCTYSAPLKAPGCPRVSRHASARVHQSTRTENNGYTLPSNTNDSVQLPQHPQATMRTKSDTHQSYLPWLRTDARSPHHSVRRLFSRRRRGGREFPSRPCL